MDDHLFYQQRRGSREQKETRSILSQPKSDYDLEFAAEEQI
jgi:hypothetical protein